jgi:hypothetical protein
MSMPNDATHIAEAIIVTRRELWRSERNVKFWVSLCRQDRARKSNLAQLFRIMAENAFAQVRLLKRHIKKLVATQGRLNELGLQMADLESRLKLLSERSSDDVGTT